MSITGPLARLWLLVLGSGIRKTLPADTASLAGAAEATSHRPVTDGRPTTEILSASGNASPLDIGLATELTADDSPGLLLWQVTNRWQAAIRAALKPYGLTHVQFVLLASLTWLAGIDNGGPVTQRELADQAATDPMMTSQVLRALEQRSLVSRSAHPVDRRAVAITSPTPVRSWRTVPMPRSKRATGSSSAHWGRSGRRSSASSVPFGRRPDPTDRGRQPNRPRY